MPGAVCGNLIVLRNSTIALCRNTVPLRRCIVRSIVGRILYGIIPFFHSHTPFCQFLFLKGIRKDIFPECTGQAAEEINEPLCIIILIVVGRQARGRDPLHIIFLLANSFILRINTKYKKGIANKKETAANNRLRLGLCSR